MKILEFNKDIVFPKEADYIYDKIEHFKRVIPYLNKKIEGEWIICIVDMRIEEMREIKEVLGVPDYVNLICYLRKDCLGKFISEYPEYQITSKSNYEIFKDIIGEFSKPISDKTARELYSRCNGNTTLIKETLEILLEKFQDKDEIVMKDLDTVLLRDKFISSRDVLLAVLLHDRQSIPTKGNYLSRYRYTKPKEVIEEFVNTLGTAKAFYSLRKYCKKLYAMKLDYLKNKDVKDLELIKSVDIYEVLHAYMSFKFSNPDQLHVILENLERRKRNVSLFKDTILKYHS